MIILQKKSKSFRNCAIVVVLCCIIISSNSLEVGESNNITLNIENKFSYNETITITEAKIQQFLNTSNLTKTQKWFIFVDIESLTEVTWPDIYATIFTRDIADKTKIKPKRECSKQGLQLETCYISSEDFNYKEQQLLINIATNEEASVLFESEIVMMKKLEMNVCHNIDSSSLTKKDAKLFKINVAQITVPYEEIRVSLTPINKIYSGEALNIYATLGKYYPTPDHHQFRSFYAWQMGVSLIFPKQQLSETIEIYLLVDYPQNYIFDLDTTLIEDYKKNIQLKTGQFYDDAVMGLHNERVFTIIISHPELNNYIRIKKYNGLIRIHSSKPIQYAQGFQHDVNMTYLTEFNHDGYLDSSKFKIDKGIKKLQLKLGSQDPFQGALYTIETYQNSKDYNWINQGQTHLSELIQNEKTYFLSRVIRHKSQNLATSEAQIKIFTKQGAISQRMFVCLVDDVDKCVEAMKNHTLQTSTIQVEGVVSQLANIKKLLDEIVQIKKITIEFEKEMFINYTDQYKQQIILIEVTGQKKYKQNVFSIEFINVGIMDTISEHESKQQAIEQGEFKIYRFTMPNDTNIKSLVFHITILYGFVQRFVTTIDPAGKTQQELETLMRTQPPHFYRMHENSIEVQNVKPLINYYLIVFGSYKSLIRVKAQLKKTMSHPVDERNITYSFVYLTTISSTQFVFEPGQLIIFDLSKTGLTVALIHGYAPLPLDSCLIAQQHPDPKLLPIEPNCTSREKIGKRFDTRLDVRMIGQKFSVYNGNNQTVPLKLSFQNLQKCGYRPIGEKQFFHARIFKDLHFKEICIKFNLYKKGPLLVSVKSLSPSYRNSLKYQFVIGKDDARHLTRDETIIEPEELQDGCQGNFDNCYGTLMVKLSEDNDLLIQNLTTEQFVFEVQYIDEPIDLIDGMSFGYVGAVSNEDPIHFKFGLYNVKQSISIVLENQRGYFTILAKLIQVDDRHTYPTLQQRDKQIDNNQNTSNLSKIYQTNNQLFFLYDTLRISQQQLKKQCNSKEISYWRACTLLISVYPLKQLNRYLVDGKFNIEVVQHNSLLKEQQATAGYVEPSMLNFYEIENAVENSTIMVYINSNTITQKKEPFYCLEPYARFGIEEKATSSNSQYSFEKGSSQLIITKAQKGTYSLTVKGLETSHKYCDYTIQYSVVSPSKEGEVVVPIKTLKKSTPFSIDMSLDPAKKTQFFLFFNDAHKTNFKILTLFEKLGEVLISVMPLASDELQKKVLTNLPTIDAIFKSEWKDSNSLEIKADDKAYCGDCMYLIKVECIKEMEGKLIIPEEGSEIAVKSNSMLYDQMVKGEKSLYRIYTESHLAFKLNMISGEINLKVKNKKNKKVAFEKMYTTSGEQKIDVIELQNTLTYDYLRYEIIEVECIKDTHFLFGFLKNYNISKQNSTEATKTTTNQTSFIEEWIKKPKLLTYGVSYTVFIIPEYPQCVTGPIQQDPIFIISINQFLSQSLFVDQLQFQLWVDFPQNKTNLTIPLSNLDIKKTPKSKVIKILDNDQFKKYTQSQASFLICFKNPEKICIDVIQSSHVNYLIPNTDILVHQSMNLTFMANEDNIIEVNECSGCSLISISKDFSSVHSLQSEIPQIRKANSLIEFKQKGPVYLSAETSGLMSLNWKDVDLEQGKNLGYMMYEPSSFRIIPNSDPDGKMTLKISPLNEVDQLKNVPKEKRPEVQSLTFEVYVENEEQDLHQAMNCHKDGGLKLVQNINFDSIMNPVQNYTLEFYTEKELQNKFSDARYVLVSVKGILVMKNQVTGDMEQYRFFYPFQQFIMVSQGTKQIPIQEKGSQPITISLESLLIVLGILIIIVTLLVCKNRQIRKFIRKLKGKDRVPAENHFELRAEITSQTDSYYQKANM